jgi:hypothetical protein
MSAKPDVGCTKTAAPVGRGILFLGSMFDPGAQHMLSYAVLVTLAYRFFL